MIAVPSLQACHYFFIILPELNNLGFQRFQSFINTIELLLLVFLVEVVVLQLNQAGLMNARHILVLMAK